jgi:nucleoside-diphosphate-sugar epimerase
MAKLSAKQRKALPSSTFAGPGRSFPIPDKAHARAALMLINKAPASARAHIRAVADAKLRRPMGYVDDAVDKHHKTMKRRVT